MPEALIFLNENKTDTLIEQTKTRPQKFLDFDINRSKQSFCFNIH